MQTRPDTWPKPVADGWARAEMRVFALANSIITDGRTNGRTKPLIESLSTTKNEQVAQGQYMISDTRCPALHDYVFE